MAPLCSLFQPACVAVLVNLPCWWGGGGSYRGVTVITTAYIPTAWIYRYYSYRSDLNTVWWLNKPWTRHCLRLVFENITILYIISRPKAGGASGILWILLCINHNYIINYIILQRLWFFHFVINLKHRIESRHGATPAGAELLRSGPPPDPPAGVRESGINLGQLLYCLYLNKKIINVEAAAASDGRGRRRYSTL